MAAEHRRSPARSRSGCAVSEISSFDPEMPMAIEWPADSGSQEPSSIMVGFAGPMRQDRLTVLTRLILAIPHFISLLVAMIATLMVIVGGWFGALFRGRLSAPVTEYLVGYHQWKVRLYAYLLLLTDKYPPVGWRDADYPVHVAVRPGRLNRLAVLFRLVLAVPALLVEVVLVLVLVVIVMPITWLIVLSLGRMPQPLYEAISAAARYLARVNGYMWLLTSEYPRGLFGG